MPEIMQASFHRGIGPKIPLQSLTIRQKHSNHTIAYLDYSVENHAQYILPGPNTPVMVRWGTTPLRVQHFYGYVNHYETLTERGGNTRTRLVSLGTSRRMNSTLPNTWAGTTRSNIFRDIAGRHKLRSIVHRHPEVKESWSSGTGSDFRALQRLSEETGYRCWVDGSTAYFLDPRRLLRSPLTADTPTYVAGLNLHEVKVYGGASMVGTDPPTRSVVYGLDHTTNEFFEAVSGDTGDPVRVEGVIATTFAEAQNAADAVGRKTEQYTAKILIDGDALATPSTLIRTLGRTLTDDQTGYWLIDEATHEMSTNRFYSHLVAFRSGTDAPKVDSVSSILGTREVTPAVVRDGQYWEASLQEHVNV